MALPDDPTKTTDVETGLAKKPTTGVGLQPGQANDAGPGGIAPPPLSLPPQPLATNDPMAFAPPGPAQPAGPANAVPAPGATAGYDAMANPGGKGSGDIDATLQAIVGRPLTAADRANPNLLAQANDQIGRGQGLNAAGTTPLAGSAFSSPLDGYLADDPNTTNFDQNAKVDYSTQAGLDPKIAQALRDRMTGNGPVSTPAPYVPWDPSMQTTTSSAPPLAPGGPNINPVPTGGGVSLAPAGGNGGSGGGGVVSEGPQAPGSATAVNGGVGLSPIDPNNSLINQTIAPNSSVDRVAENQKSLQSTIDNILNPQFKANLRDTSRLSFGAGRGDSGQNRTSLGNVESDYNRKIADLGAQSSANAATGSIDDMYRNIAQANQQQQFQAGQQESAFGQDYATRQLQEALTNGAFGRASAQNSAGQAGSPADISLILSQIFGNQSSAAGAAASGLFNQQGQKAGGSGSPGIDIAAILKQLGYGGGSQPTTNDGGYEVSER